MIVFFTVLGIASNCLTVNIGCKKSYGLSLRVFCKSYSNFTSTINGKVVKKHLIAVLCTAGRGKDNHSDNLRRWMVAVHCSKAC